MGCNHGASPRVPAHHRRGARRPDKRGTRILPNDQNTLQSTPWTVGRGVETDSLDVASRSARTSPSLDSLADQFLTNRASFRRPHLAHQRLWSQDPEHQEIFSLASRVVHRIINSIANWTPIIGWVHRISPPGVTPNRCRPVTWVSGPTAGKIDICYLRCGWMINDRGHGCNSNLGCLTFLCGLAPGGNKLTSNKNKTARTHTFLCWKSYSDSMDESSLRWLGCCTAVRWKEVWCGTKYPKWQKKFYSIQYTW